MDRLLGPSSSSSSLNGPSHISSSSGTGSSKKHTYNYKQTLSNLEEFEADESLIVTESISGKRFSTAY